ncbi:MAG: copper homeostasis protein CutC [Bacteroidia bacterium]|nr:copper homeostasis protein CutC [Bacteroidia bacterium]
MNRTIEVCVETFQEAEAAVKAGAMRIELCADLFCGGTTPSFEIADRIIKELKVPIMVMIRPRGGDFCYTQEEFELMCDELNRCHQYKIDGVVFGILNPDETIDIERTKKLVRLARPMQVTFHKAIDETPDLVKSVQQLKDLGVERILSSGGKPTALEGKDNLLKMTETAGPELQIIVAGKVTWENLDTISQIIPNKEYHGRRIVNF